MNEQHEHDLKECPFCREQIPSGAVKCRYCKSDLGVDPGDPVCRDLPGRILAGVAAYASKAMGISVSLVRLVFVVAAIFLPPLSIGVYVGLWLIVPFRPEEQSVLEKMVAEAKRLIHRLKKRPIDPEKETEAVVTDTAVTEVNGRS